MKKPGLILFALSILLMGTCLAQSAPVADTLQRDTLNRFDYHLSFGTGVYSGWGETHSYTYVAPTFEYRFSPKFTAFAGFAVSNDVNASLYQWPSRTVSYAPLKNSTRAGAAYAGGIYRPNDKLTIAASAFYIGGQFDPLWHRGSALDIDAYGVSAAVRYRFNKRSSLSIYFDYVRDKAGTLVNPWMMHHMYCDPFYNDNLFRMQGTIDPMGGFNEYYLGL